MDGDRAGEREPFDAIGARLAGGRGTGAIMQHRRWWGTSLVLVGLVVAVAAGTTADGAGRGVTTPTSEAIEDARARSRTLTADRATDAAMRERQATRRRYAGQSAREAISLARRAHRVLRGPVPGGPKASDVVRFLGDRSAVVRQDGRERILASTAPLRTHDSTSPEAALDLTLERSATSFAPRNDLTGLRIGTHAADPISLEESGVELNAFGGAANVPGEAIDGRVFWPNVATDTDAIAMPTPTGIETFVQLRSEASPEEIRMPFRLPSGAQLTATPHGGGFQVVRGGDVLAHIAAPSATGADGAPVALRAELRDADSLVLTVPHRAADVAYPVLVDPVIEAIYYTADTPWTFTSQPDGAFRSSGYSSYLFTSPDRPYLDAWMNAAWELAIPRSVTIDAATFRDVSSTSRLCSSLEITSLDRSETFGQTGRCGAFYEPTWSLGGYGGWERGGRVIFRTALPGSYSASAGYDTTQFAGAYVYYSDYTAPTVTSWPPGGGDWSAIEPSSLPYLTAEDAGVGVKEIAATEVGTGWTASRTHDCTGQLEAMCPTWWDALFSSSTFGDGRHVYDIVASDLQGNQTTERIEVRVDREGPELTSSGPLQAASGGFVGDSTLHVEARDGSAPLDESMYWRTKERSGVTHVVLLVDGASVDSTMDGRQSIAQSCAAGGCSWEGDLDFRPASLASGSHSVSLRAFDAVGNVSTSAPFTVTVDNEPPVLTLSGALWNARGTVLQAGDHDLTVNAGETTGTGVKDVEISVGGVRVDYAAQGCPAGSCSLVRGYTFATDGFAPGPHTVTVTARDHGGRPASTSFVVTVPPDNSPPALGVGIEDFFAYRTFETGAGSQALVNTANGNLVWHLRAASNRGRGLDTNVDVTYNALSSKEDLGHGYDEIGDGFSLSISTLTRLNEALDLRDAGDGLITLTDADGTMHRFRKDPGGDWFNPPPGVNLRLRRFHANPSTQDEYMKVWAATRTDGTTYFFDECGYQRSVQDRHGNRLVYEYEAVPPSEPYCFENTWAHRAKLRRVVDAAGVDGAAPAADRSVTLLYTNESTSGDPAAQIASITDHAGRRTTFAYTTTGQLRFITQAAGTSAQRRFAFGYEGEKPTDNPCGTERVPGSGRQDRDVVAIQDPRGNCTELDYLDDATLGGAPKYGLGERVNWIADRNDHRTSFTYPSSARVDAVDARGKLWQHESDARFRPAKRTDPLGVVSTYAYDGDNNLAQVTEAAGTPDEAITRLTWNGNGQLLTLTDPLNQTTDLVYRDHPGVHLAPSGIDAGGTFVSDLLRVTKPRGVATATAGDFTTVYDVALNGEVRSETDEEGYRTQYDYTATGLVKEERQETERDEFSKTTFESFDANGLPQLITDARGNATTTAGDGQWKLRYDRLGNLLDAADPRRAAPPTATNREPFTTEYGYDALDRPTLERIPKDSAAGVFIERTTQYDVNDNVEAIVDGNTARSTATYNAMDRPVSIKSPQVAHEGEASPAAEETQLTYDAENNVELQTAPNGSATSTMDDFTTAFTYDAAGRLIAETRRSRGAEVKDLITSYAYDRRDNVVGVADPRRNTTGDPIANAANPLLRRYTYVYDRADRRVRAIERRLEPDPVAQRRLITKYRYDADGNVVAEVDPRGTRLDPANPELEIPDAALEDRFTTEYAYDERGERVSVIDPKDRRTAYEIRGDGQPSSVTSPRGTASPSIADDFVTRFQYDPAGDLVRRTLPRAPGQYGPAAGWSVTYTRDEVGNPRRIRDARDNEGDPAGVGFENSFWDTGDLRSTERPSFWLYDEQTDELRERSPADPTLEGGGTQQPTSKDAPGDFGRVLPEQLPSMLPTAGLTSLAYDGEMRLTSVTDAQGHVQTIGRDEVGRPTTRTWPYEGTITVKRGYDRNGNLRALTDGENNKTTYAFDQFDRPRSETRPGSVGPETTKYTLDESGNLTLLETPRGTMWTHRYDSIDRRTATIDPRTDVAEARRRTTFEYDATGNKVLQLPPRGQSVALPDRNQYATFWQYDEAGQLEFVDAGRDHPGGESRRTSFEYDADGNRTVVRAPGSKGAPADAEPAVRVTRRRFDGRGLLWTETTGTGSRERTVVTEYDGNGNLRRRVNPAGVRRSDELPREAGPSEADLPAVGSAFTEHATVFAYNRDNLLRGTYLPWGRKAAVTGDDTDREAWWMEVERDGLGRITDVMAPRQIGDAERVATHYTHYGNGWIHTSKDRGSSPVTLTYTYDRRGLQTSWTNDKGRVISRQFFPNGLLKQRKAENTNAEGKPGETRTYTYGYSPIGSLLRMTDIRPSETRTTEYAYDALERQLAVDETWKADRDTTYSYDDNGNVLARRTDGELQRTASPAPPLTGSEPYLRGKVTTFEFDPQNRETLMRVNHQGDTENNRSRASEYWPSNQVREWRRTRTGGSTVTERRYFADDGRLLQKTRTGGAGADAPRLYEYDDAENDSTDPTKWGNGSRSSDERGTHVFNSRGHLVRWNRASDVGGGFVRYLLNGNGSVRQATASIGSASVMTKYIYDTGEDCSTGGRSGTADRLTYTCTDGEQTAYGYDGFGSLEHIDAPGGDADDTHYRFDVFERMISERGPDDDVATNYSYDGLDRRDYREKDGERFEYGYIGSTEMLSRDDFRNEGDAEKRPRHYDYDSALNRTGFSTGTTDQSKYRSYSLDANGSVERLEDANGSFGSDTTGATSYRYDPYGQTIGPDAPDNSDAANNPFRFQGFYFDESAGSYDMQARNYSPGLQRFLSADRFESASLDLGVQLDPSMTGRYAFAAGNPVDNIEFDGHCANTDGPCPWHSGQEEPERVRQRRLSISNTLQRAQENGIRTINRTIAAAAEAQGTSPEHEQLLRESIDYDTALEMLAMSPEDVQRLVEQDRYRRDAERLQSQRPGYWDYFKEFNTPDLSSPVGVMLELCRPCRAAEGATDALRIAKKAPSSAPVSRIAGNTTRSGVKRTNPADWRRLQGVWDEAGIGDILSASNRQRITKGRTPVVDEDWVRHFPDDRALLGERIPMHHVGGSPFTVPLPDSRHLDAHMPGGYRYNPGGPGRTG
jgi:RHS repeat-associated protein